MFQTINYYLNVGIMMVGECWLTQLTNGEHWSMMVLTINQTNQIFLRCRMGDDTRWGWQYLKEPDCQVPPHQQIALKRITKKEKKCHDWGTKNNLQRWPRWKQFAGNSKKMPGNLSENQVRQSVDVPGLVDQKDIWPFEVFIINIHKHHMFRGFKHRTYIW